MEPRQLEPIVSIKTEAWPALWKPEDYLDQIALFGRSAFACSFQQKPTSDADLIFSNFSEGSNYDFGINWKEISDPDHPLFDDQSPYYVNPSWPRYTGCDLSGRGRKGTAILTLAISPDGVRHIIDIRIGAWGAGPDFVRQLQLVDSNILFSARKIFVENNAIQGAVIEWIKEFNFPCWPKVQGHRTGTNKMDPEIGLPGIDVQYLRKRWRIAVPHRVHIISQPSKKDPSVCVCGPCMFIRDTLTFTINDLDETPDTIMAQFMAKEASRQGERYSDSSANVVKVSQKDIQSQISSMMVGSRKQSLRIPVGGTTKIVDPWGSVANLPHPDGITVHPSGTCARCDMFPSLQPKLGTQDGKAA
jgi:hypothetical protein